jgi:IS6 family transposase
LEKLSYGPFAGTIITGIS